MTQLTKENFDTFIKETKKPVIIDFWAEWCGPCKIMTPVLDEIAKEHDDIEIAKVNVDTEAELAIKYGIMSIPAFILFKDGEESARTVGYMPKSELLSELGL